MHILQQAEDMVKLRIQKDEDNIGTSIPENTVLNVNCCGKQPKTFTQMLRHHPLKNVFLMFTSPKMSDVD